MTPVVMDVFWRHRRRYGARRVVEELRDSGITACRRTVAKIMKNQGLLAIQPKSFKPKTTESRHRLGYNPNLLLDDFQLTRINQLWVADITYIPLEGKRFAYLAMLMDRCSWTDSPGGYPATSKRASLGRRPSSAAPFIEVTE